MAIIDTYAETRSHKKQKLEITIRVYDPEGEPCMKTKIGGDEFYTHIDITHHGKPWGCLFLPLPVKEADFKQAINDVYSNIEAYKNE